MNWIIIGLNIGIIALAISQVFVFRKIGILKDNLVLLGKFSSSIGNQVSLMKIRGHFLEHETMSFNNKSLLN